MLVGRQIAGGSRVRGLEKTCESGTDGVRMIPMINYKPSAVRSKLFHYHFLDPLTGK
jgi:hypothetical protein